MRGQAEAILDSFSDGAFIVNLGHGILPETPPDNVARLVDIVRGRDLRALGNTPGHIQHWSKREFLAFLVPRFEIVTVRSPFPWTMALCQPHGRIGE